MSLSWCCCSSVNRRLLKKSCFQPASVSPLSEGGYFQSTKIGKIGTIWITREQHSFWYNLELIHPGVDDLLVYILVYIVLYTLNSSIPVETTFCWSREESPRSAASLSSLNRATGYSLHCVRAPIFVMSFNRCLLLPLVLWPQQQRVVISGKQRKVFIFSYIRGPSDKYSQYPMDNTIWG